MTKNMGNNKTKLMEMAVTPEGYSLNNLSPFFLHKNVYELLEKSRTALLIYKDLQKIASSGSAAKVIDIIQYAGSEDIAMRNLVAEYNISEQTARYLLDSSLDDMLTLEADDYTLSIEIYEEATKAFTVIAEKQKYLDSLITD